LPKVHKVVISAALPLVCTEGVISTAVGVFP